MLSLFSQLLRRLWYYSTQLLYKTAVYQLKSVSHLISQCQSHLLKKPDPKPVPPMLTILRCLEFCNKRNNELLFVTAKSLGFQKWYAICPHLSTMHFIFSACGKIHSRRQNSSLVFQLRYVVFSLCRLKIWGINNSDTFL